MSPELQQLRAALAEERLARQLAEARLEGFCRALQLLAGKQVPEVSAAHAHLAGVVAGAPQQSAASRAPGSVTASVTERDAAASPSVTQEKKKEQSKVRSKVYRIRKASVTERDGASPSVTAQRDAPQESLPFSSSSLRPVTQGTLRVVSKAAREARQAAPRRYFTPSTLPGPVAELREAYNALAAPHGFAPWPERSSPELVADGLAALERRPLEEWRRVFALMPRSPLCRGELRSRQRVGLVWMLVGRCHDGYEPAEKLLTGAWTVDPEPEAEPAAQKPPSARAHFPALPSGSAAESGWGAVLAGLREDGKSYALEWLRDLVPVGLEGRQLVLGAPDIYFRDWVKENFSPLLTRYAEEACFEGVRVVAPDEGAQLQLQ
ncbi:MAG TPA: hypothetical protein VFZ09_01250 [Archangium sp.]|uniref:hypothetical protein n=1 Tax=Archangium sp. TaxID=1872627 RepID=UPI002E344183|nr:hypothetical protein [Archangium sp.]HEX5744835.1 hypothetical protein [Archangium sp.]